MKFLFRLVFILITLLSSVSLGFAIDEVSTPQGVNPRPANSGHVARPGQVTPGHVAPGGGHVVAPSKASPAYGGSSGSTDAKRCPTCKRQKEAYCQLRCNEIGSLLGGESCVFDCVKISCSNVCRNTTITPSGPKKSKDMTCDFCIRHMESGVCQSSCDSEEEEFLCIQQCAKKACKKPCGLK